MTTWVSSTKHNTTTIFSKEKVINIIRNKSIRKIKQAQARKENVHKGKLEAGKVGGKETIRNAITKPT